MQLQAFNIRAEAAEKQSKGLGLELERVKTEHSKEVFEKKLGPVLPDLEINLFPL